MTHRKALEDIMRICYESSEFNRRIQNVMEISMLALGMTLSQRNEKHIKAAMRSEAYKESAKINGRGAAKKHLVQEIEEESGEKRSKCKSIVEKIL